MDSHNPLKLESSGRHFTDATAFWFLIDLLAAQLNFTISVTDLEIFAGGMNRRRRVYPIHIEKNTHFARFGFHIIAGVYYIKFRL